MKRVIGLLAVFLLAAVPASAQIQMGFGLGAAVMNRSVSTEAHIETGGVVRVDRLLDASPQLIIEFHRSFKVSQNHGVGPMIGIAPHINFGSATNAETEQPVGAGFGGVLSTAAGGKHRINIGLMWMITAPLYRVDDAWKDGYQAPRGAGDVPLQPRVERRSVNRLMLTMSVSGIF